MRRKFIALLVVAVGGCGWFGRQASSDDGKDAPKKPSEAEMEKMMEMLGTPGEPHKWLASFEGAWDVASKTYGADGKAEESKGSATFKMILGGRWQEQVYNGSYKGKPFEGRGLTGYDNGKKEFVNYWLDGMSTSASVALGQCSDDHKVLTMSGEWEMPGMKMPFRMVQTVKSDKEMVFRMVGLMGGQELPMVELTYTRK